MLHPSQGRAPWLLPGLIALAALGSWRLAEAGPMLQSGPACRWDRLASGERLAQHSMVEAPGPGVLAFGGADTARGLLTDELQRLDLGGGRPGAWSELRPAGQGPGRRAEHTSVLRGAGASPEMIAFGGVDVVPRGSTLTWRSPLLGGGRGGSLLGGLGSQALVEGTFRLSLAEDGPSWAEIESDASPSLTDHSAVYDPASDAMIVFGGRSGEDADSRVDELWRLGLGSDAAWEQRLSEEGPWSRFGHSAVLDVAGQRMLVYGGTEDWGDGLDEVWSLDLSAGWESSSWTWLQPGGSAPPGRYDHAAVYLPELRWMLVYGGSTNGRNELGDLWALDLNEEPPRWHALSPAGDRPPNLRGAAAAYSSEAGYAVFQGGASQGLSDRLTWALVCWAPGAAEPTPEPWPFPTAEPTATEELADPSILLPRLER